MKKISSFDKLKSNSTLIFCFQLIVAVEKEEIPRLEGLLERGNQNGVKDLRMLGPKEIKEIEPNCEVNNADSSPTSVEF